MEMVPPLPSPPPAPPLLVAGVAASSGAASVRDEEDAFLVTPFCTRADGLLRKNLTFQKRNAKTNACIISVPVLLCLFLLVLQIATDVIFSAKRFQCGCQCVPVNDTSGCQEVCGVEYSSESQAASCAVKTPSLWPAFLQIPSPQYRAVEVLGSGFLGLPNRSCRDDGSCPVTFLYTGNNKSFADGMASLLLQSSIPNSSVLLTVLSELTPGTDTWTYLNNYIEPAIFGDLSVLPASCSLLPSNQFPISLSYAGIDLNKEGQCVQTQLLWKENYTAINNELYQGFRSGNLGKEINEISVAYDFGSTHAYALDVTIAYNATFNNNTTPGPPGLVRVSRSMNLAAQAFLRTVLGPKAELPLWFVSEMPKPETKLKLDFASLIGPLFYEWVIQLLFPVILMALVYEKQYNLRMMMKMHGLGDGPYVLISYSYFLALSIVYIFFFVLFGSLIGLKFFRLNSYSIQFVFYVIFSNVQIAWAFLVSTIFANVRTATVVGYMYVFGSGLLGKFLFASFLQDESFSRCGIFAMELVPAFALYRGLYELSQYSFIGHYKGISGMGWSNLNDSRNGLKEVFGILLVEWLLFLLLAYYLDQVVASGSGLKKSPLFFLKSILPQKRGMERSVSVRCIPDVNIQLQKQDVAQERQNVEKALTSSNGVHAIVCDDLTKVYPGRDGNPSKHAVRGLSLAIHRGECFGMLGPNGAGKTTSISMMIGLLKPTSGTIYIEGLNISENLSKIYSSMGVCPQHDLLWETLTGREHLLFYGRLKNLTGVELTNAVEASLRSVNLFNGGIADKQAGKYSGGMKRRLSVAISLIGNPKVVYMDEPSTGLDPTSRSNLWEVVKKAKRDRAIILTTHSMEEAETLCDRLCIFVNGELQCIGNSKELKSRYGGFYMFSITTPQFEEEEVFRLVQALSPSAKKVYGLSGTQKFELPKSEVKISNVFDAMEKAKAMFTVQAWGFADTTLEDVFINVAKAATSEKPTF